MIDCHVSSFTGFHPPRRSALYCQEITPEVCPKDTPSFPPHFSALFLFSLAAQHRVTPSSYVRMDAPTTIPCPLGWGCREITGLWSRQNSLFGTREREAGCAGTSATELRWCARTPTHTCANTLTRTQAHACTHTQAFTHMRLCMASTLTANDRHEKKGARTSHRSLLPAALVFVDQ